MSDSDSDPDLARVLALSAATHVSNRDSRLALHRDQEHDEKRARPVRSTARAGPTERTHARPDPIGAHYDSYHLVPRDSGIDPTATTTVRLSDGTIHTVPLGLLARSKVLRGYVDEILAKGDHGEPTDVSVSSDAWSVLMAYWAQVRYENVVLGDHTRYRSMDDFDTGERKFLTDVMNRGATRMATGRPPLIVEVMGRVNYLDMAVFSVRENRDQYK